MRHVENILKNINVKEILDKVDGLKTANDMTRGTLTNLKSQIRDLIQLFKMNKQARRLYFRNILIKTSKRHE